MDTTRTALVTGGGTGLGRSIARQLADDGFHVTIVGRRADVLNKTAQEIGPDRVRSVVADCASPADMQRLADGWAGPLDTLVLNAGGNAPSSGTDLAAVARDWRADFTLNVLTAVLPTQALLPRISRPGGRIIAMSSVAALRGSGPNGAYGAVKGAINTWVTGLAAEVAAHGITVNAIAPGFIPETEFWDDRRTPELIAQRTARIRMGRAGTPAEVAALVGHLASEMGGFVTGQVIGIHGGTVLARL